MNLQVVFLNTKYHDYWLYEGVQGDLSNGHYFGNRQRSFEPYVLTLVVI